MTRRFFLQGTGGFLLGMPLLESMVPKALAQAVTAPDLRFLLLNNWYGRDIRKWYAHDDKPTTKVTGPGGYAYRSLSDLPGDISQILPLSMWDAALRKKMTMVRGLDVVDIHDGHNSTVSTSATLEGGPDRNYHRFAYSLDSVIEKSSKFYPTAPRVGAIRMSPVGSFWDLEESLSTWSWTTTSQGIQELTSYSWPHTVYQKFFSKIMVDQAAVRAKRLQVTTNAVYADYSRVIASEKISSADRQRLDNYMQLLSQAEKKLGIQATTSGGVCAAPASASGLPTTFESYKSSSYVYEVSRDLMTAGLMCGMTKIGILNQMLMGEDFTRDDVGNDMYHDCAHNPDGEKYGFPAIKMNRFLYDHNAKFLKQLDSVPDTNGNTLLDNTLVYIANDDSSGGHHLYDMPVILAGAKGVLRTDMMIDYRNMNGVRSPENEDDTPLGRPYNNLLVTLFQALGLGPETYKMTPDQKGFGYAPRVNIAETKGYIYRDHYGQFMTDAAKDQILPYLLLKS